MKFSSVPYLTCPLCHHALHVEAGAACDATDDEVIDGALICSSCGATYPITDRLPNLVPLQQTEAHKLTEMEGWVKLWEKLGMYQEPHLDMTYSLPFVEGVWRGVAEMFVMALDELQLTGREVILEIGAGQGWAARYFAARGCRVFATDLVADKWFGIGRAWSIMDHYDVYFEPMLADGERLPYPDNQFDVVFFCGALHHFARFDRVLSEVRRVLKPGGRLIGSGEPSIALLSSEMVFVNSLEEVDQGITERRPRVFEYQQTLRSAGFAEIHLDTYETYHATRPQILRWLEKIRRQLPKVTRARYRPLLWLVMTALLLLPTRLAAQAALYINGGNLFIRAVKPASAL